jgi:hypothetical protein
MGRRCACKDLLTAARSNPQLRVIPPAARWLWLMLSDIMLNAPEPGVLQFGLMTGSPLEISMMVSMTETEVETQLETIIKVGLISRRDDGVLVIPAMQEASRRVTMARQNGGFGGRPRRGETAEQAKLRRTQGNLVMPIQGGLSETQENQNRTERFKTKLTSLEALESKKLSLAVNSFELGSELAKIAGVDPASERYGFGLVTSWLDQGATPELLREVFCEVTRRPSYQTPDSIGYFTKAVRDRLQVTPPAVAQDPAVDPLISATRREFFRLVELWKKEGQYGAPPNFEGMLAEALRPAAA